MSKVLEDLTTAMKRASETRPKVGGFPHLAEALKQAGATRNVWSLPSCQSLFLTHDGAVVMQGTPLVSGASDVPAFDKDGLIKALRTDQAGQSTFPQFLDASVYGSSASKASESACGKFPRPLGFGAWQVASNPFDRKSFGRLSERTSRPPDWTIKQTFLQRTKAFRVALIVC